MNCNQSFYVSTIYAWIIEMENMVLIGEYQCYHCKSHDTEELPTPKRNYTLKPGEERT